MARRGGRGADRRAAPGSGRAAVFPAWSRWLLPVAYGLLYGVFALAFWRVSLTAARWPAAWFSLLGGLVSLVGHGIGIRRGLLKVPLLAEASAASALAFGVFEFVFYWCAIAGLAAVSRRLGRGTRYASTHSGRSR